jgi:putative Holliday junction resolvase
MRYLAIDFGSKNTGLAICDRSETVVSPLAVIPSRKNLLLEIADIVKKENVEAVVLGLPLNMDDSQGPQAKLTLNFAEKLKKAVDVPVYLHDERLSSFAAEEKLAHHPFGGLARRSFGGLPSRKLTRKKKRQRLDALAAAEILQAFIDSRRSK